MFVDGWLVLVWKDVVYIWIDKPRGMLDNIMIKSSSHYDYEL